jgi:hypothetical protein
MKSDTLTGLKVSGEGFIYIFNFHVHLYLDKTNLILSWHLIGTNHSLWHFEILRQDNVQ